MMIQQQIDSLRRLAAGNGVLPTVRGSFMQLANVIEPFLSDANTAIMTPLEDYFSIALSRLRIQFEAVPQPGDLPEITQQYAELLKRAFELEQIKQESERVIAQRVTEDTTFAGGEHYRRIQKMEREFVRTQVDTILALQADETLMSVAWLEARNKEKALLLRNAYNNQRLPENRDEDQAERRNERHAEKRGFVEGIKKVAQSFAEGDGAQKARAITGFFGTIAQSVINFISKILKKSMGAEFAQDIDETRAYAQAAVTRHLGDMLGQQQLQNAPETDNGLRQEQPPASPRPAPVPGPAAPQRPQPAPQPAAQQPAPPPIPNGQPAQGRAHRVGQWAYNLFNQMGNNPNAQQLGQLGNTLMHAAQNVGRLFR